MFDRIAAIQAKPMTHKVVTGYVDGSKRVHETRGEKEANNFAIGERRKIGCDLINRATGETVRVVFVTIEAI